MSHQSILLAVSGGGDSMAMLHVLARLQSQFSLKLFAHGINHGLRSEATAELDLAERLATQYQIPFFRSDVNLEGKTHNLQARAREVRYQALFDQAAHLGCHHIATAHHANDRAETILMRLLRGANLYGLDVLSPLSQLDNGISLFRPLIHAHKSDVLKHLERNQITIAEDPSNHNTKYLRVKVRKEILPSLEELSPNIVNHLIKLSEQVKELK